MRGSRLVEFGPVELGPFTLDHVPLSGAVAASAFLLALGVSARQARRLALRPSLMLELFALGAPLALLASRVPALATAFPAFLHDAETAASALASRGSTPWGLVAACLVAAGFAWASRAPARFLDALAPGALLLVGAAFWTRHAHATAHVGAAVAVVLAAIATLLPARLRPGITASIAGAACLAFLLVPPAAGA